MKSYTFTQDTQWSKSQWLPMGNPQSIRCCDCGLVHEWNFKLVKEALGYRLYLRTRKHIGATKRARKRKKSK